jgi:hypothetical protein
MALAADSLGYVATDGVRGVIKLGSELQIGAQGLTLRQREDFSPMLVAELSDDQLCEMTRAGHPRRVSTRRAHQMSMT